MLLSLLVLPSNGLLPTGAHTPEMRFYGIMEKQGNVDGHTLSRLSAHPRNRQMQTRCQPAKAPGVLLSFLQAQPTPNQCLKNVTVRMPVHRRNRQVLLPAQLQTSRQPAQPPEMLLSFLKTRCQPAKVPGMLLSFLQAQPTPNRCLKNATVRMPVHPRNRQVLLPAKLQTG